MADAVEAGGALAWRLFATLEGGTLLLAASVLLVFTVRRKLCRQNAGRVVKNILVTNIDSTLGKELKRILEKNECTVTTLTDAPIRRALSGLKNGAVMEVSQVDALVVIGEEQKSNDLEGMADLVSRDVYDNLKLLEQLSPLVHYGGFLSWACAGPESTSGAFKTVASCYDAVLSASLHHVANNRRCVPLWVGRTEGSEQAARKVAAAILSHSYIHQLGSYTAIRAIVYKITQYFCRWVKKI